MESHRVMAAEGGTYSQRPMGIRALVGLSGVMDPLLGVLRPCLCWGELS